MKGIQGLIVAIGLTVAGALLNWVYLASRTSQDATISFVGIKTGQTVNRGETLRDEHLVELAIPARWAGNLRDFAVLFSAKETVVGRPVWRTLSGECLLLNDDLKTAPEALKLEEGERIMWIPVESRSFVPSLVAPGDEVMFLVPRLTPASPGMSAVEGVGGKEGANAAPPLSNATNEIGPFRVRALGNRLGSAQVWAASKLPLSQENVIGISVRAGERQKAMALWDILQATNYRQVGIEKLEPTSRKPQTP